MTLVALLNRRIQVLITVRDQIQNADKAICLNIEKLSAQRALLSQNVLSQLRNLVEGLIVLIHRNDLEMEFHYKEIEPGLNFVRSKGKLNFLSKFHKLIQKCASHFTMDGDNSERLMLNYYEYLYRIRSLLQSDYKVSILRNLEDFPVDTDPSLREYHEKIADKIDQYRQFPPSQSRRERYYIHKTRPFFCYGRIFYEVTFYRAINKVNKFDRIIAFTDIDMTDKYAANLNIHSDFIEVINKKMPIMIINEWWVSIRPCEFDNYARILGFTLRTQTSSKEYKYLMKALTLGGSSLLDLIEVSDEKYCRIRTVATDGLSKPQIFPVIDETRRIIRAGYEGQNILRYLLLRMHNQLIKRQYQSESCSILSNLNLKYACKPFDEMPFCTSLPEHNPRYWDLVESIDTTGRSHEILARRVGSNVERHGSLYTPLAELQGFDNVDNLISTFNRELYYKHTARELVTDKGHVFIRGYEDDTVTIINKLQEKASKGIPGYSQAVERWIDESPYTIDDPIKRNALKKLFEVSCVALIYGSAGTGKTTMVNYIALFFNKNEKLFLAHTNPAVDNLKRKVAAGNSEFRTISSILRQREVDASYDLIVIDESSTVSNSDLLNLLKKIEYKLLVLVGDVYQIESIQFGNWFSIIRSFIPKTSVFELKTPFRSSNESLLAFWDKVRRIDDDIVEVMAQNNYSTVLDKSLFENREQDEIILCLNYDGLYGINNVNRFLQSSNDGTTTTWGVSTYKIGDPVLFSDAERFRPVIYNNLKGTIIAIENEPGRIQFDIELARPLSEFDVWDVDGLEWVNGSTVRFSVYDHDISDDDIDSSHSTVPFQVAYAVSIHKAQGLEFDSVKIVITDANEEDISHSIFYTAITRARNSLKIFWTPETQQGVVKRLKRNTNGKDIALISNRRGLTPSNK